MNRIVPTALAAAALATGVFMAPPADAGTLYIAGTRKLQDTSAVPPGEFELLVGRPWQPGDYQVAYPRELAPFIGTTFLDDSVAQGAADAPDLDNFDTVVCVSQGCLVREQAYREDQPTNTIHFVNYGDPTNLDGGIVTKLPKLPTIPKTPATPLEPNQTHTDYAIEYDIIADAPDRPNIVSYANAALGFVYDHNKYSAQYVADAEAEEGRTVVTDLGNGSKHVLIKQDNLPLTRPIRQVEKGLTGQERVSDALDRVLRPVVDSGYTGTRTNTTNGNKVTPKTTVKDGDDNDDRPSTQRRDEAGSGATGVSRSASDDRPSRTGEGSGGGES